MNKKLFVFLLFCLPIFTIGCNDNSDTRNGTSDSGGGNVKKSTAEDVRAAVPKALGIIHSDKFYWKISFASWPKYYTLSEEQQKLSSNTFTTLVFPTTEIFKKMKLQISDNMTEEEFDAYIQEKDELKKIYKSDLISDYIDASKIYFLEKGPCPASDKADADASVDKFTLDARICLSIDRLQALPKEDLIKHIVGLLTHELAHMFGYGEDAAVLVQDRTVAGFRAAISSSAEQVPFAMYSSIIMVSSGFENISLALQGKSYIKEGADPKKEKIKTMRFLLGYIVGQTDAFDGLFNEDGRPIKVFYSEATKPLQNQISLQLKELRSSAIAMSEYEDDLLLSAETAQKILDNIKASNIVLDQYRELLNFYDDLKQQEP
ncbi:MAG: hypothetical protein IT287_04620 [Bdellovibrionaceae bacterium]|nr:hypothetical protein [Pseudobdellovibrionaceae bacterium]